MLKRPFVFKSEVDRLCLSFQAAFEKAFIFTRATLVTLPDMLTDRVQSRANLVATGSKSSRVLMGEKHQVKQSSRRQGGVISKQVLLPDG